MSEPIHIRVTMARSYYVAQADGFAEQYGSSTDEALGAMVREIWLGEPGDDAVISVTLDIDTEEYNELEDE